jgi:hypothetical protein
MPDKNSPTPHSALHSILARACDLRDGIALALSVSDRSDSQTKAFSLVGGRLETTVIRPLGGALAEMGATQESEMNVRTASASRPDDSPPVLSITAVGEELWALAKDGVIAAPQITSLRSETELQCQLQIPRRERVARLAELRAGDVIVGAKIAEAYCKVRVIENIKGLHPELQIEGVGNAEIFEQGNISRPVFRPQKRVAANITDAPQAEYREEVRRQGEPVGPLVVARVHVIGGRARPVIDDSIQVVVSAEVDAVGWIAGHPAPVHSGWLALG